MTSDVLAGGAQVFARFTALDADLLFVKAGLSLQAGQEGTRAIKATKRLLSEVLPKGQRRLKFEDFEAPTTRVLYFAVQSLSFAGCIDRRGCEKESLGKCRAWLFRE